VIFLMCLMGIFPSKLFMFSRNILFLWASNYTFLPSAFVIPLHDVYEFNFAVVFFSSA
jgi:hypothetical protein